MRIVAIAAILGLVACQQEPAPKEEPKAEEAKAEATAEAAAGDSKEAPTTAAVGEAAPEFSLKNLDGEDVSLASFEGKTVVLEWFNPDCPFVKYSHSEGPLKELAETAAEKKEGLVWLAINSGAPGKQGHGVERNKKAMEEYGMSYDILVDEDGAVGKAYGAKTTPHMYVISPEGTLEYAGALDNAPMGKVKGDSFTNYVTMALDKLAQGEKVDPRETKPYGCSVKYGS